MTQWNPDLRRPKANLTIKLTLEECISQPCHFANFSAIIMEKQEIQVARICQNIKNNKWIPFLKSTADIVGSTFSLDNQIYSLWIEGPCY